MQKRIMMLGGNHVQITATQAAKDAGYHVISVDYLPNNPAHKIADEYHNVSTIDKEAVLSLAKELKIDGIVSYASDVSAPTAAYVATQMGLPTNPYESVMILTHKDLFRAFLRENGFPMPQGKSFKDKAEAFEFFKTLRKPVMVKPVDASGSKGVNKLYTDEEFSAAWDESISYSIAKQVIVEEFIESKGYQIDGDIFVVDGEIRFWGVCDQHHDFSCSAYTPAGLSFPPTQDLAIQKKARDQIERMFKLLGMKMGGYNIEYIVGKDDEVYMIEIGPRNGGNLIPDTIKAATGFDMASYVVRQAVGDDVSDAVQVAPNCCCSSYVVHSLEDGIFDHIEYSSEIKDRIVVERISVKPGDAVKKFRNGSFGLGTLVLRFSDTKEACDIVDNMNDYIKVVLR